MKNFIQDGKVLTLVAPAGGVVSGVGYVIGGFFAIAAVDADAGDDFDGEVEGVFSLTKHAGDTFTQGAKVFWDNTAKEATSVATGNRPIGAAVKAVADSDATVTVALLERNIAPGSTIADITLAAVAGVDGTGNNAASKADVDARFATVVTKVNAIVSALEAAGVITTV